MKSILFGLIVLFSLFFSHLALAQKPDEKSAGCLTQECHPNSQQEIDVSVHSNSFLRQKQAAVEITCFTCHLDHKKDNPQVANQPIARGTDIETCGNCHSKERRIFFSRYHGKYLALGKGNNPTCVYCHAGHELPKANVLSPINPKNIGRICAGCHGGDESGKQKMAATLDSAATGRTLYRKDVLTPLALKGGYTLLTLAFVVFGLLCVIELTRGIRGNVQTEYSSRLPKAMLIQIVLFVLFYLVLDSSGITLLYAHEQGGFISKGMAIASQFNMQFFQNADFRSLVHRLAALLLIILFMAHLIYLWRSRAFRQFVRWTKEDSQTVKEELRLRQSEKTLWKQKWTYFQMLFLVVVMLITGILQWRAFTVMKYLPFKVIRYADIIHEWNGRLLTMYTYGILIGFFGILRPLMGRLGRQRGGTAKAAAMLVLLVLPLFGANALAQEKKFTSAEECKSCHEDVYNQWKQSFHAQSVKTPTFAAALTIFNYNTQGKNLEYCFKCHAPEVKVAPDPLKASYKLAEQVFQGEKIESEGVTCAICHSIKSVKDEPNPEVPIEFDIGPTPPYHNVRRTPLFFRQELCGSCHDYNTTNFPHPQKPSTPCCDANRDWKRTSFAQKDITCQSCHMRKTVDVMKPSLSTKVKNSLFSLTGLMRYRDKRERVSHLIPGGRSQEMLKKAVVMGIESRREGNTLQATVAIKNLTGHSIPNG